jgi:hypothetical protein
LAASVLETWAGRAADITCAEIQTAPPRVVTLFKAVVEPALVVSLDKRVADALVA